MKELKEQIGEKMKAFSEEAAKAVSGNKSAGRRSRKLGSELTQLFKQWRKVSVPADDVCEP